MEEYRSKKDINAIGREFLGKQQGIPSSLATDWRMIMTHDEIQVALEYVAEQLNERYEGKQVVFAAILKGAYVFLSDLTRLLTIPYSVYFVEVSSYHGQKQSESGIELLSKLVPSKFHGRHVVLIDELFDNGVTMNQMKEKLLSETSLELTADRVFTCTLFSKKSNSTLPKPDLVGISDMCNVWLVGYGLDDNGEKRGWKHLFACPKIEGIPKTDDDAMFDAGEAGAQAHAVARRDVLDKVHALATRMKRPRPQED